MKILVQGRKTKRYKRFECRTCGCVFLAERSEYKFEGKYIVEGAFYGRYSCSCPNCNSRVYSTADDEIVEE